MTADLAAEVAGARWYHGMELPGGIVTPGVDDPRDRLPLLALPDDMSGLTVLDVGAWDGFFSFEAERRGAARVVAADSFAWSGTSWGSKEGFELARRCLGSRVEDVDVDVLELDPERLGRFDLVLFLGVLYHLRHPLLALDIVSALARDLLVVQTLTMPGDERATPPPDLSIDERAALRAPGWPAMAFIEGELAGDPTNWWAPNAACVEAMVRSTGLRIVEQPGHEMWLCEHA